jgi:serine/threonine protein kinase
MVATIISRLCLFPRYTLSPACSRLPVPPLHSVTRMQQTACSPVTLCHPHAAAEQQAAGPVEPSKQLSAALSDKQPSSLPPAGATIPTAPDTAAAPPPTSAQPIAAATTATTAAAAAAPPHLGFWELLEYIVVEPPPTLPMEDGRFSPELRDFVCHCLVKDAAQRVSVEELSHHPFLAMHRATNLSGLLRWAVDKEL